MHVLLHYRADVVLTLLTRRDLDNIRVRDSTVNVVQPSIDHITIYLVASRYIQLCFWLDGRVYAAAWHDFCLWSELIADYKSSDCY